MKITKTIQSIVSGGLLTTAGLIAALGVLTERPAFAVSFQGIGDLGRLPRDRFDISPVWREGFTYSSAAAISADGSTVVGNAVTVSGEEAFSQAYAWTRAEGIRGLGVLEGYGTSGATDVSGDGSVIVGSANVPIYKQQACLWTAAGDIIGLGSLGSVSRAYGVSEDGKVVVGEFLFNHGSHAFRWDVCGGMVDLGDLPGAHEQSSGYDVSEDGSVIVGYGVSRSLEAFRWDDDTGMVGLGVLPEGRCWSTAHGVSSDGTVVVGSSSPSDDPWESEAFLWTVDQGLQRLGDLPGGLVNSGAVAVSASGRIIVGHGTPESYREAVLWDPATGIHTIRELLIAAGIHLNGWILYEATDISADGTVVVGNGVNPEGNWEGWIAVLADEEPPVIVDASASPERLWPPNNKMVTINVNALVEDDSGQADWKVFGIACDETHEADDLQFVNDHTVRLRATRSGKAGDRVYTLWLRAEDAAGNLSEPKPVLVTVSHDQGKKLR